MSKILGQVLITRPLESAKKTAKILDKKNIPHIIYPLFSVEKSKNLKPIAEKIGGVLITSSHGVFALKELNINQETLILTVGQETFSKVKELGYKNTICANNSAQSMLEIAQKQLSKKHEILYLSGNKITLDLAKELCNQGFVSRRIIVYKTIEIQKFSTTIINEIKNEKISEVLIYSQNTLKIFHKLIQKHDLFKYFKKIKISCFSSKIADLAKEMKFPKIDYERKK